MGFLFKNEKEKKTSRPYLSGRRHDVRNNNGVHTVLSLEPETRKHRRRTSRRTRPRPPTPLSHPPHRQIISRARALDDPTSARVYI